MSLIASHIRFAPLFGIALVAAVACGEDDGVEGSGAQVQASVDPATAQLALGELTGNVDTTVVGFAANPGADGAVITVQCASGGDAAVDGYVNVVPLPVSVDVQVAINYNGCTTPKGTLISGDVNFAQKVVAGPGQPLQVQTTYRGDVEFTGAVEASCPVDLNVLVDEAGRSVQVSGTFCGQNAAGMNLQLSPYWSNAR